MATCAFCSLKTDGCDVVKKTCGHELHLDCGILDLYDGKQIRCPICNPSVAEFPIDLSDVKPSSDGSWMQRLKAGMYYIGGALDGNVQHGYERIRGFIESSTSVERLREEGVDADAIFASSLRIDDLIKAGYSLSDMRILGFTWEKLHTIGFDHRTWARHYTMNDVRGVYKNVRLVDIYKHTCYSSTANMAKLRVSAKEWNTTFQSFVQCGLNKNSFVAFDYTLEAWKRDLGATLDDFKLIGITYDDIPSIETIPLDSFANRVIDAVRGRRSEKIGTVIFKTDKKILNYITEELKKNSVTAMITIKTEDEIHIEAHGDHFKVTQGKIELLSSN